MSRSIVVLGVFAAALAFSAAALSHADDGDGGIKDHHHFYEQALKDYAGGTKAGSAWNMVAVGHNDLGARGFNGDVWEYEGYAYVGQWGFADWAPGNDRFCPSGDKRGVAVVDVRDPADPTRVSTLLNPEGTSAEDVVVYTAPYGPAKGRDIAAVGLQYCGGSRYDTDADRGLMLWDVTTPAKPVQIGYLRTACCARGVHEFEVQHRADLGRTFAYATVPTSRYPDSTTPSGYRDENGDGDFRLFDITNPAAPFQVSDWGIQDAGGPFSSGQGCDPDANYGHGAEPTEDGKAAFVSYWDSGFVKLDLTNPATPVYRGRTVYGPEADGDAHSSQYDEARKLLFGADEDFCKTSGAGIEKGYGYMRVYDYSNPSAPKQIGSYRSPNSLGTDDQAAGDYVLHNNFLVGTTVYQSWYSDGVRVVDVSNPRAPKEVAYFVPPATTNPVKPTQRGVLTNTTQVWGVVVDEATGLVYASDMNSGLWILRRTG
ncbi:MAG: LVIVD repeat-containing protein [Pseudomonadota bacterium]